MAQPGTTKENALVVVALDVGTTFSGWAYSFRKDFKNDNCDIKSNHWKSGGGFTTDKTPTAILFDPKDAFHSFGYDAETKYAELVDDEEVEGWKFFKRFKMALLDENEEFRRDLRKLASGKISNNQKLKDVRGQKLPSLLVFSETIRFLKDSFLKTLQERASFVEVHDIHWVLTIPAIWSDKAKHFMRTAAKRAGISDKMLTLAYEPEAAAIYCKTLTLQKKEGNYGTFMTSFEGGQRFLVVDCGGGTVDITAYEVLEGNKLEELSPPSGGPWGGTEVDKNFLQFLKTIFGHNAWQIFENLHSADALDLERNFEAKKKSVGETDEPFIRMICPNSLFDVYKSENETEFKRREGVQKQRDKLKFPLETLENLFTKSSNGIISHVTEILQKLKNIEMIVMVGGFSDSAVLYKKIKDHFLDFKVLRPDEAVLSVVKGAVIYGHAPEEISERVSHRTYGIACNVPFNAEIHPRHLLCTYDGRDMCSDIFNPIVHKGDPISINTNSFQLRCLPCSESDTEATVDIYSSSEADPKYTFGDMVKKLGTLSLDIPNTEKGKDRPICVRLSFQSTEIAVSAVEEGTNNEVRGTFSFHM